MSYPDYPNNRLIVNGVDLTTEFKMVLVDGYSLEPPEPKTYVVDIPGGNGTLDLTEALMGDTAYKNRKQEFEFYIIDAKDLEKVKTRISNFLHGKRFDYQITMDPGYTYNGRFSISSYLHSTYSIGKIGVIKIAIDANPFKLKPEQVFAINAVGGKTVYLKSGRMRVRPVVETDGLVKVIFNHQLITLQQGSWVLNDLVLTEGENEVYFNSYDIRNLTWGDLKTNSVTWEGFKANRLYEWYRSNGDGNYVNKTWADVASLTWNDLAETAWSDHMYKYETTSKIKNIYVKYDWGDL